MPFPPGAGPGTPGPDPGRGAEWDATTLDPVDLALIMKAQTSASGGRDARRRYASLVVMCIVFVVLMVIGLVMVSHVHAGGSGTSGVVGTTLGMAAFTGLH